MKTRLRRLYMEGHRGWFRPLLSADSYSQFQRRLTYLSTMASWEHELLSRYEADLAKFAELKKRQARVRHTLVRNKQRTGKNLKVMKGIKGKKQVMLTSLKRQTRSHEQALSTLQRAVIDPQTTAGTDHDDPSQPRTGAVADAKARGAVVTEPQVDRQCAGQRA